MLRKTLYFSSLLKNARYPFASQTKPPNIILIRHAQSVFNAKCHQYPEHQIYSKEAEEEFHHDPEIIDCQITENAYKSLRKEEILHFFRHKSPQNTIFFASPMLRALQTTQMILETLNKNYEVKVLPQLSEVLSKICDFSSGVNNKKEEFHTFDFRHLDQWILENNLCEFAENWQDPFLDKQLRQTVDSSSVAGKRYLKVLKERFPQPLESAQNCRLRSISAFHKILEVSRLLEYKNAVVVSHNRVLKNIQTYLKGQQAVDFQNLQIRKMKVPQTIINSQERV